MLSEKIVVVQASKDSGALYTAKCGLKYNKEVYAVPGSIYDRCNIGSNILISNGVRVYISPESLGKELLITIPKEEHKNYNQMEDNILKLLNKEAISLDAIKVMLGLNSNKIEELLFSMEIKGNIKQVGGLFSRCN